MCSSVCIKLVRHAPLEVRYNTSCIRYNCMVSILIHLVSQDTRIWILLGTSYQSAFCRVGKIEDGREGAVTSTNAGGQEQDRRQGGRQTRLDTAATKAKDL